MHERRKLEEARYFYGRMVAAGATREDVQHNFNALLSSARSVLQYAYKELKHNPNGVTWYEGVVKGDPVITFLRDKRNLTIHEEPVAPTAKHTLSIRASVSPSGSMSFVVRDKDGNVKHEGSSEPTPPPVPAPTPAPSHTVLYVLRDWNVPEEDVPTLCQRYLHALATIVNDGVQRGYISG